MKNRILAFAACSLLGCSSTQQAAFQKDVAAAVPLITPIADIALTASGNGEAVPVFNALSGMALAYAQGNDPVAASALPSLANAIVPFLKGKSATTAQTALNAVADSLPVK